MFSKLKSETLQNLALLLRTANYEFVTISPKSHAIFCKKHSGECAQDLRDIFGWSLPFVVEQIDVELRHLLEAGDFLDYEDGYARSRVRCSSANTKLFFHSAFPTEASDSVFFGPDSYRFINFLKQEARGDLGRLVDIGCGTGVGGIVLQDQCKSVVFTDINPLALSFAQVNSEINASAGGKTTYSFVQADLFNELDGKFDTIISNPPFIIDEKLRAYRHGGGQFGTEIAQQIAKSSFEKLNPSGRLFLYTGAPQIGGEDIFKNSMAEFFSKLRCTLEYREIDPDIFGEELSQPCYDEVERLAAVPLVIQKQ